MLNKKVLILGANGQLGSDLTKIFANNDWPFIGLTRADLDVLTDDICSILINYQPQYIINCIAVTNVDGCEDNSELAFNVNTNFVYKLTKFCYNKNIILIHISTDYVFDGQTSIPYTEKDLPNPLNVYGLTKYASELVLKNYHDKYFIFRVSSIFGKSGASGKGGNFITTMQCLAQKMGEVSVIDDQITSPTATTAIAKCIFFFIKNEIDDYGLYHIASSSSCSWYEFAQAIFTQSGFDSKKVIPKAFINYTFKAKRPQYSVLATTKLNHYYTMPAWQESLQEYFKQ